MDHQLRVYRLKAGRVDDFLALWRDHLVAAREAHGFEVVSSYVNRETPEFAWVVRYTRQDGFAAGDARYYSSPERASAPWDAREAIESAELRMLDVYNP